MSFFIKREKIVLAVIVSWTAFVCFFNLTASPSYWFDEGIYHQVVHNFASQGIMGVRLTPTTFSDASLISVGYPVLYPAALAFKLFGDSLVVLRLTAVVFLFGLLFAIYLLARNLYGVKDALYSTLLVALFSPLYGDGKSFLGEVPGMFYFVFGLVVLNYAIKIKPKFLLFLAGGILLGLASSSKPNFLVILPALALGLIWKWREFFATKRQRIMTAALAGGVLLALTSWIFTQFGVGTSLGRVLTHYSNPYYIQDIWPVIFANLKRFFSESTPVHFLLLFISAITMLAVKLLRRQSLRFAEVVIMLFIGAIVLFYLRTAGWYRYFFPAHILLFIFLPASIEFIGNKIFKFSEKSVRILLLVVIISLSLAQFRVMQIESFKIGLDVPAVFEPYLNSLNHSESVLFYSVPYIASYYHSDNFYQFIKMSDFLSLGAPNVHLFKTGFFSRIVIEDKPIDFSIPNCYKREATINRIVVFKRNNKANCL